jgi:hypothetical protein
MSTCKTKADLHREYARVLDLVKGDVDLAETCVRFKGHRNLSTCFSWAFNSTPEKYSFALLLLDGVPVFEGDKVWLDGVVEVEVLGGSDNFVNYTVGGKHVSLWCATFSSKFTLTKDISV